MRRLILALALVAPTLAMAAPAAKPVRVLDGDTIVVGKEHIRLLGIDAPELPGHCRKGRTCAPGDPFASRDAMRADVLAGPLVIHRLPHKDKYGRTVADVWVNGKSLSCLQLEAGQAIYWAVYDNGKRIAKECPAATGIAKPVAP